MDNLIAFDKSFSFAIVRNPWDWLVSWYAFVRLTTQSPDREGAWKHSLYDAISGMSFADYIDWITKEHGMQYLPSRRKSAFAQKTPVLQSDWITNLQGGVIVNQVGRFENLEQDVRRALNTTSWLAQDQGLALPHVNRSERESYQEYYTQSTRNLVSDYFKEDIDRFEYTF